MVGNVETLFESEINGCVDLTVSGKCSGCGECCSNLLPLSDQEIKTIKKYIKRNDIKERVNNFPLSIPAFDLTCPFLDTGKQKDKCRIYIVRPQICRRFKCNQPRQTVEDRKALYSQTRKVVNMRKEFFEK